MPTTHRLVTINEREQSTNDVTTRSLTK